MQAVQQLLPVSNMRVSVLALVQAPGPGRRMNLALLTVVPSLDSAQHGTAAREALLLAVWEPVCNLLHSGW